jgi:hypothetical protein
VRYEAVEYLKLEQVERLTPADVNRLPFVKRLGFAAEEEYRVIAETSEAQEPALSIDFPTRMIDCIYLNPWLPRSIAASVRETLRSLPGCGNIRVSRSQLIESGRWKAAGDKVVGKSAPKKIVLKHRS